MPQPDSTSVICQICKQPVPRDDAIPGSVVRDDIADEIKKQHPDWSPDGFIC